MVDANDEEAIGSCWTARVLDGRLDARERQCSLETPSGAPSRNERMQRGAPDLLRFIRWNRAPQLESGQPLTQRIERASRLSHSTRTQLPMVGKPRDSARKLSKAESVALLAASVMIGVALGLLWGP